MSSRRSLTPIGTPRATGVASVPPARARHPRRLSQRHREWLAAYCFLAPDLIGLLLFIGIPMLLGLGLGFFNVNGFGGYAYAGLHNYQAMFSDPLFFTSLRVTLLYAAMLIPGVFVSSLILALLVKRNLPLVGLFRTMFFLPNIVSLVVTALMWKFMLVDRVGLISRLLSFAGLGGLSWLGQPNLALVSVVAISVWTFMGFYMIIFLGALQDIPNEYYDAARIDGAGSLATFRHITWPLIAPTSLFVFLLLLITGVAGLQSFDLIYVMTNGGPDNGTSLGIFYIYQQAFQYNNYGYAAAMASFLVVVLVILSFVAFRLTGGGRFEYSNATS